MKKRILIALLCVVLVAAAAFMAVAQNQGAAEPNTISQMLLKFGGSNNPVCPYCGVQPENGWTALDTDIDSWQRLNGHYYLTADRANSSYYAVVGGNACVYLNASNITAKNSYAFQVEGGTLTVMGTGNVTGSYTAHSGVGATVDVVSGTLNLCGGTFSKQASSANAVLAVRGNGSTVNMYAGTAVENGNANNFEGGNVRITAEAAFNMYGGTISGGQAYCGGNVAVMAANAQFNMYGGSVIDGKAQLSGGDLFNADEEQYARGGNIYITKGKLTQTKGAAISGGSAYTGGNIYYDSTAAATLSGTVSAGNGYTAGNIDLRGGGKMTIDTGAVISNGNARYDGGNIQVYKATLELNGGTFTGGTAGRWGGSIMADGSGTVVDIRSGNVSGGESTGGHGGNVCVDNAAKLIFAGGILSGGKASHTTEGKGGNIYAGDATVQITGGNVTMGVAYVSGGNIHIQETTQPIAIDGCDISHGQAAAGGNICVYGAQPAEGENAADVKTFVQIGSDVEIKQGVSQWPKGSSFAGGGGNIFCQGGELIVKGKIKEGTANLTGGNIEVRNATFQLVEGAQVSGGWADYDGGNIAVNKYGILVISESAVTGGTAGRTADNIFSEGNTVLEATAQASDNGGVYVTGNSRLRVYGSFDGNVAISGLAVAEPVYGVTLGDGFECLASFSGKLWLTDVQDNPCLFGKDKKLFVGAVYTVKDGVKTWHSDNATAVAGYGDADYLVPQGDLTLAGGNYVIDLAGQALNITGSGRMVCFDSSNDTYKICGNARIDGPILMNQLAQTVAGKHYIRIKSNGVYSFHRMDLKVSDVSLRVSSGGIYYSARWECDDAVKALIQGFGIGVSLADMPTENLRYDSDTWHTYHSSSEFVSGIKTNGVLIKDILKDSAVADANRVEKNSTYGKMPIYAKAYVVLDNGVDRVQTLISNDDVAASLHDVMASIDDNMPLYYSAAQRMQEFRDYWKQNGLSGAEWDFEFHIPIEIVNLQQKYSTSQLLTGQLHDRLDNSADLTAWKSAMEANGIDFAGCLENGTVSYISGNTWDSNAFVGGIEARFTVDGKPIDCDMLFASYQQMEAVLSQSTYFAYSNGSFQTKAVSKAVFVALINAVKQRGGLFLMAHPKEMGLIDSKDALDYWFADGTAIDIGTSQQNYKLWTDLLTEGKQVWAVSSNADQLSGLADTLTLYAEEKTAQEILQRLARGEFANGRLGLKMAIGNAVMGDTGAFTGEKLVIGVDQAPAGVLQAEHSYRIDLITKSGVKASWPYTGRTVYEILDADEAQAFYRLEVVDETTGERIAVGNPIWNSDYGLKVGFARENITPDYTVLIVGGKQRVSEGVLDNDGIFLTCVAVQEGDQTVLVYTADFIGPYDTYVSPLKHAVSEATGVSEGNIIFNTTHTHSGVGVSTTDWSLLGDNGETNRLRFLEDLNAAAVRTAKSAISDLTPVEAAYAGTAASDKEDVAFVRHYIKRNGSADYSNTGGYDVAENILQVYSKNCQYKAHATDADNEIQLVKFSRGDNKKDVILMSVPAHGTLNENSTYLSADFPNYARRYIESNTGSLVAYFIGAAGDQVPRSKLSNYYLKQTIGVSNNTDAKTYGEKLGGYAVTALQNGLTQLSNTSLKLTKATYEGQVNVRSESEYTDAKQLLNSYNAGTDITTAMKNKGFADISEVSAVVRHYEYVAAYGKSMSINIKTMAIGDLGFVFAPYEMSGANGKQIKQGSPYANTFISSCAEDTIGYVASQDAYDHNSYEAWSSWLAEGSGEKLAKRYIEVLEQQKYNLN